MGVWAGSIADGADDGYVTATGTLNTTNSTVAATDTIRGLFRFAGVAIPASARITSATLEGQSSGTWATGYFRIFDTGDAPPLSPTDATAPLVDGLQSEAHQSTGGLQTWDVTELVQAAVTHPGWAAGNALKLAMLSTTADAMYIYAWESTTIDPARLVVEYADVLAVSAAGAIEGRTVTFTATARPSAGGEVTGYVWDFGDGTTGTGPSVSHVYTSAGTFTATVTVTDSAGATASAAVTVTTQELRQHSSAPGWTAVMAARTRTTSAMAEVLDGRGNVLATLGGPGGRRGVVSGSVVCDGGRAVRWTCDLEVTDPGLVPVEVTDLLHPLSHNRVRVWWLVRLPDGTWARVPVGTYFMGAPRVEDSAEGGFRLALKGADAAKEIARAGWDRAMSVAGMTNSAAIEAVLADRAPWAQFRVTPTDVTLPTDYELGATGDDPWADVQRIAEAAGMVAYVDRLGVIVVEPAPGGGAPVAQFVEGPDCTVTDLSRELSVDDLANIVIVEADSNDVRADVYARSEDRDPSSPLSLDLGYVYFPPDAHIKSAEVTTVEQAQAMADQERAKRRALVEMVEVTHRADPTLTPGDTVSVARAKAGLGGMFQVASWSLALGAGSGQRTVMNDRRLPL